MFNILKTWSIELIYLLRKSTFIIIMIIMGCIIFWDIDQIRDVTREILYSGFKFKFFIFQILAVFWAIQTWYSSRSLFDFTEFKPKNKKAHRFFQKWLPRFYGAFIFLIISFAFIFSNNKDNSSKYLILFLIINLILLIIFFVFVIIRRRIFKSIDIKRKIQDEAYFIQGSFKEIMNMWGYDFLSIAVFIFFMILFIISKVSDPQFFGTDAIIVSFLAFFTSTFVILIYLKKYKSIPVFAIAVILFVLCSYVNNNHWIKLLPKKQNINPAYNFSQDMQNNKAKINFDIFFKNWFEYENNNFTNKYSSNKTNNIFIIAVEGGGMRSAYWSSYLLSSLQDLSITNTNYCRLNEHVFAISSVSGGSLGSAVYLALVKENSQQKEQSLLAEKSGSILGRDFLSPVIGSLFYPDFLQRFLPFPIHYFDRALALEKALESSWQDTFKGSDNYFTNAFYSLWDDYFKTKTYSLPFLFLNTSSVEKGNRVIISTLPFYKQFSDCVDFNTKFSNYSSRIPLSTASFLSARFPYITPAARVYNEPDKLFVSNKIWGHIDDGGYFENSGSATAFDILTCILKNESGQNDKTNQTKINFNPKNIYAIVIKNDPVTKTKPSRWCYEITQPILTFFNTWMSRTPYSTSVLKNLLGKSKVIELNLLFSGEEVPVGWYLSDQAQQNVKEYIHYLIEEAQSNSINNSEFKSRYSNTLNNLSKYIKYKPEDEWNIENMRKLMKLLKVQ